MEVVDSVLFSQLNMDFEARSKKIFKPLQLFKFPVELGHHCQEWLWQFGSFVNIVMEICRIVVVCQLKGQQTLVCFNHRRSILTAELRLAGGVVPFLLSLRCIRGSVSDFFKKSCHHVMVVFWARVLCRAVVEDARFRLRITLGVVLVCSLACTKCNPGSLQRGSGVTLK